MFESDGDWNVAYDFDKIMLRQKKELIQLVFNRQLDLVRLLYSGRQEQYELGVYREVYRKQLHYIIFGLKRKMNFYQFSEYIASFSNFGVSSTFFLMKLFRVKMEHYYMEMFGMFGGDLAKVFDFDKIDLQKKQEFVQLVFLRMRELLQQRQGFCLLVYEKSYIEQRHNIVSNLKGKFNFYKFSL